MSNWWPPRAAPCGKARFKKKETASIALAQNQEIQQLIQGFASQSPDGPAVQQLELLIRAAIFKPANELAGVLFQQAADRIDAACQPKSGWVRKGRVAVKVQGVFGIFELMRDSYYHAGQKPGFYPADAALGLEEGCTPALARLICLEGADETSFIKAENLLRETGGIGVEGRQIQRVIQRIGEHGP